MTLKTGRVEGVARVTINRQKCSLCGLCAKVCTGGPLYMEEGQLKVDQNRFLGCFACGHCMTVCPLNCIEVEGRDLTFEDVEELPKKEARTDYEKLKGLMLSRRSIRKFIDKEVDQETVKKIVEAATTAPMGIPPSEVGVLIISGRKKIREFKDDLLNSMKSSKWMYGPLMRFIMRPFIAKEGSEMMKEFIAPVIDKYIEMDQEGKDYFFYDAPLAMYFYGSAYCDPVDPVIAATYAMLAAESLGLGTCILGFPAYTIKYSKKIKEKYGIPKKIQSGMAIIFGYSAVHFQKAIKRRFASVKTLS